MKNIFTKSNLIILFRILLGGVFIYASIDKIANPLEFSNSIDNYHVTPIALNNIGALLVPWLEFIIGFCIIFGFYIRGATLISIILLIWFVIILSQALIRGIDLHCGCFDLVEKTENVNLRLNMIYRILQDLVLILIAFFIKNNIEEN